MKVIVLGTFILNEWFLMPTLPLATQIVRTLSEAGHTAYFAGGWVRDKLMGHASDDIDIATSASVEEIAALFPKTIPVGALFGILIVREGGHPFEVATFRKDAGYLDGRRPISITRSSPEEDAKRRDFTINGLFWDPLTETLYDFVEGERDIRGKLIRAIGDPQERFFEDRLRMMRAVRYATRFRFALDPATKEAILANSALLLPSVALERIWQEFKKMSRFAHFDLGLIQLHEFGLLPVIFPELKGVGLEEIQTRLRPLQSLPPGVPPLWEFSYLFPHESVEELMRLCDYLRLSRAEKESVAFFRHATALLSLQHQLEEREWVLFYAHPEAALALTVFGARLPPEQRAGYLCAHKEHQTRLAARIQRVRDHNPPLRAEHLFKEGFVPGKTLGELLDEAERIHLNEGIDDPGLLIDRLKRSPLWRLPC
jgi:poly(A) polymerase